MIENVQKLQLLLKQSTHNTITSKSKLSTKKKKLNCYISDN